MKMGPAYMCNHGTVTVTCPLYILEQCKQQGGAKEENKREVRRLVVKCENCKWITLCIGVDQCFLINVQKQPQIFCRW